MKAFRPVAINASHRVQSITPKPHVHHPTTFRPISQSPPPFSLSPGPRASQIEDIFGPSQHQISQGGNITLLSRGISLLSIPQLRELLREYSLQTGGKKHELVSRLVIYLETFGHSQSNLITQFSARLKALLAVEQDASGSPKSPEPEIPANPQMVMNQRIITEINEHSPSCLYRPAPECPVPFGPVPIPIQNIIGFQTCFTLAQPPGETVPILQFVPVYREVPVRHMVVQIGGVVSTFRDNALWMNVSDLVSRQATISVMQMEPVMPVILIVRWMKKVPLLELSHQIVSEREFAPECTVFSNGKPSGICPLTRKMIARPARGVRCAHGDCFDLTGFLSYAMKHNSWACPICHSVLTAEDLRIDPNFFNATRSPFAV